jgi:hypothetical protein
VLHTYRRVLKQFRTLPYKVIAFKQLFRTKFYKFKKVTSLRYLPLHALTPAALSG